MKNIIKNLYTRGGGSAGERITELKRILGMGSDTPSTDYVKHSLATAANDFLVASGAGAFAKQTLAQAKSTLGLGTAAYTAATAYVTHALATATNDFIVASGAGTYVKKTVEQTRAILEKLYEAQENIAAGESEVTLSNDSYMSYISTDSAGDTFFLPDGNITGQLKKILMKADGGDSVGSGNGLVKGTFGSDVGTLTFNTAGEFALLQWNGTQWVALELGSMLDTTNAPTFSS